MLAGNMPGVDPKIAVVVVGANVCSAWQWWLQSITPLPVLAPGDRFIFDQKRWGQALACLNHDDPEQTNNIAVLYLASQILADPCEILSIVQGQPIDVCVADPSLDPQIRKALENPATFPHALSENMAFWTQLATIIKMGIFPEFIVTLPNTKSTDPGPDGLSLSFDGNRNAVVELRSVKSSINDPSGHIATADFRRGLEPDPCIPPDAQLDEFYLVINDGYGFTKLERLLVSAFHGLHKTGSHALRVGLIRNQNRLNAMLVADDQHARPDRFEIYSRIPRQPADKIATYIGADQWQIFAESIRQVVINTLTTAGVL